MTCLEKNIVRDITKKKVDGIGLIRKQVIKTASVLNRWPYDFHWGASSNVDRNVRQLQFRSIGVVKVHLGTVYLRRLHGRQRMRWRRNSPTYLTLHILLYSCSHVWKYFLVVNVVMTLDAIFVLIHSFSHLERSYSDHMSLWLVGIAYSVSYSFRWVFCSFLCLELLKIE